MQPSPISTDQQLGLILQGASEEISWMATDPLVRNAPVQALRHDDAEAGHILVLGDHNQAIVDLKYPATGEGPVKKRGEGWYSLNIDTSAFKDQSLLIFHRMRTGTNNQPREIRKQQLIRIAHPTYYRYLPIFRLMLDKSRKSLASPDQLDGQDVAGAGSGAGAKGLSASQAISPTCAASASTRPTRSSLRMDKAAIIAV